MTGRRARIGARAGTVLQIGTVEVEVPHRVAATALPPRVFGFVGRAAELAVLRRVSEQVTSVQVCGGPGTGKSALAVEAAHTLQDHYPDGRIALELHGHDGARAPTGHELLGRTLRALAVPDRDIPCGSAERVARYRAELSGRRVLVLADDVADPAQVQALLPPPGSLLIVTSRRMLSGPGAMLRLAGLDTRDAHTVLAQARPHDHGLTALAVACEGLPLALRIVTARLALEPRLTVAELTARLRGSRPLGELSAGDRALGRCFGFSYDRVGERARLVFRRCGLLPLREVGPGIAATLTGLSTSHAAAALTALVESHLVVRTPVGRYRMHDLLRSYAAERGEAEDSAAEREAAARRLVAHLVAALPDPTASQVGPAAEWENLFVVADWLAQRHDPDLQLLADRIDAARDPGVPWEGWLRVQRAALADAELRGWRRRIADLQTRIAISLRELTALGHPALDSAGSALDEAAALLRHAEWNYRLVGDGVAAAGVIGNRAEILRDRRTPQTDEQAAKLFGAVIALLGSDKGSGDKGSGDKAEVRALRALRSTGWALYGLGDVRTHQGRVVEALACQRRALRCFRRVGYPLGEAWAWHGRGEALRRRGRPAPARVAFEQAMALHETTGDKAGGGWAAHCLAETLLELDAPVPAARAFARARCAAARRGDRYAHAEALRGLGDAADRVGDRTGAIRRWGAALTLVPGTHHLAERLHERLGTARTLPAPARQRR